MKPGTNEPGYKCPKCHEPIVAGNITEKYRVMAKRRNEADVQVIRVVECYNPACYSIHEIEGEFKTIDISSTVSRSRGMI